MRIASLTLRGERDGLAHANVPVRCLQRSTERRAPCAQRASLHTSGILNAQTRRETSTSTPQGSTTSNKHGRASSEVQTQHTVFSAPELKDNGRHFDPAADRNRFVCTGSYRMRSKPVQSCRISRQIVWRLFVCHARSVLSFSPRSFSVLAKVCCFSCVHFLMLKLTLH